MMEKKKIHKNCRLKQEWIEKLPIRLLMDIPWDMRPCEECEERLLGHGKSIKRSQKLKQ